MKRITDFLSANSKQTVRAAQFVKPYRKSNKNDFLDAEATAEAVTKQNMRFVRIKTQEQLDVQAMHRVRDRLVQRRTALIKASAT